MNHSELNQLLEAGWHRPLEEGELAAIRHWCREHPEMRGEIEADLALFRALHQMPDVPVPSNFVSQVWEAVDRSERAPVRPATPLAHPWLSKWIGFGSGWMPRFAVGTLLLSACGVWLWERQISQQTEIAAGLTAVSQTALIPELGMLKEFEAIRAMTDASGPVDMELLAALQ